MIYVFLGLAVLVISFLIALLTLIREQRQTGGERDVLEEQSPPQVPPFREKTEVPITPQISSASLRDNLQNSGNLDAVLPYPWDQKSRETDVPPGVGAVSGDTKGDGDGNGNGNLVRGGEFIIPRSEDRD